MTRLTYALLALLIGCGTAPQAFPAKPCATAAPSTMSDQESRGDDLHQESALGVRFRLPEGWHRKDVSEGGVKVILFGPDPEDFATRISLLLLPAVYLPEGIVSREAGLKAATGDQYRRVRLEATSLGEVKGELLVYEVASAEPHRTAEYAFRVGEQVLVVQFASPTAVWEGTKKLASETLRTMIIGEPVPDATEGPIDDGPELPPFETAVQIQAHDIDVRLDPAKGSFESADTLKIVADEDGVSEAKLLISKFQTVELTDPDGPLEHSVTERGGDGNTQVLAVKLRRSLRKGERVGFTVRVATSQYDFRTKNSPVSGYHMLGQVGEDSSYSSHTIYYPVDEENRAKATIRFHVPEGYLAVGPGRLTGQQKVGDHTVFTWTATDGLVKQLPYGWAVAKYGLQERRSGGRVPIRVYSLPGRQEEGKRVLKVAVDVVSFYERRFGPFPFGGVSIADVRPAKGIAGVSLPSMVLLSQQFFRGSDSYDALKDVQAAFQGPLVIADELSHQYNFYSVALPNQLAEGMAQYTDSVFAEEVGGIDMADHFAYYARIYRGAVQASPDRPIMSDGVYKTDAYMAIVFSKGACVLHMLRTMVGDSAFFATLRQLFTDYRGKKAGVAELQAIAEIHAKTKLGWFFEQWYQRSGYPQLKLTWEQKGDTVHLELSQEQEGEPFRLPLTLALIGHKGQETRRVELKASRQALSLKTSIEVDRIELSKAHPVLAHMVGP